MLGEDKEATCHTSADKNNGYKRLQKRH